MFERIHRRDQCRCNSGLEFGNCCGKGINFDTEGNTCHVSLSDPNEPEIGAREGSTIVKVQLALNGRSNPALIYNRGQTFRIMVEPAEVEERMAGRPKAFFYAQVSNGRVALGDEAPRQDW